MLIIVLLITNLLAIMPMTNSIAPIRRPRKANASMPNFHDVTVKQEKGIGQSVSINVKQKHSSVHLSHGEIKLCKHEKQEEY